VNMKRPLRHACYRNMRKTVRLLIVIMLFELGLILVFRPIIAVLLLS
jgi:hypothetical protein